MIITKLALPRRTFLRGIGTTLALPLLDSMVPAQTPLRQTGAAPRSRLVCIEMVHGAAGQHPLRRRSKLLEPPEIRREFRFVLLAGVAPCLSGVPDHRQQHGCPPRC